MASDEWTRLAEGERQALMNDVYTRRTCECGDIPQHYTATTVCQHYRPVPIFSGVWQAVEGEGWYRGRC